MDIAQFRLVKNTHTKFVRVFLNCHFIRREIMEIIIQRNGNMPFLKPFPHFRTVKNIQCRQHESALPPECGGQFFCSQRITDITLSAAGGQQFASGIRQFFIQRHPSAGTGCGNGGKQSGRTTADNSNI